VTELLPACIGLDKTRYGIVTALLTAGGLFGSMYSDRLVRAEGAAGAIAWTGWLNLASAALMAAAPHWLVMALGRCVETFETLRGGTRLQIRMLTYSFVAGLACGLAVCLVPPYLAALARSSPGLAAKSGQVGVLHQLAIVIGICCSQGAGLLLTGPEGNNPGAWRWVCAASGVASIVQILMTAQPIEADEYAAVGDEESANGSGNGHRRDEEEREPTQPLSPTRPEGEFIFFL
jgi:MFS family permease